MTQARSSLGTDGPDGPVADALLRTGRFFTRWDETSDGRAVFRDGGRAGDVFYRDRWNHDKVVRSTHGVNCNGSCSWKVYVKDGIITWESQQTDWCWVMAIVLALQPDPEIPAGTSLVMMAAFLGLGTGGVFAWVATTAPQERVGSVTSIVGAAGGLGGFFPPLVMGATYNEQDHSYTIGLSLLCAMAMIALVFTVFGIRRKPAPAHSAAQPSTPG